MNKFRKKPVVIEARQLITAEDFMAVAEWLKEHDCSFGMDVLYDEPVTEAEALEKDLGTLRLHFPTREGWMCAVEGDWVIKGVKGEFYPCKPDIFEMTYEPEPDNNQ